ncbi:transcription factor bHLH117-like [Corylus avellana]|uniref:transcription factor bHLH117-like n=1 Tax=Corylus avellana TaxID=13451 RepID=UPI001E1F6ACA|nr:transcription factor bHLH117-like [Corylus avellana]
MPGRQLPVAPGGATEYEEKLMDRFQKLEELMPWDHKMDTVDMLVEAEKYAKYLQAQLKVLQEMPAHTSPALSSGQTSEADAGAVDSEALLIMKNLSRNQLLQFLVNSPKMQSVYYPTQTCIFSAEQLPKSADQQK